MKTRRGFTLVELMIAIAVVGVLLVLAAPSFYDFIRVQRLKSINAQLVTDLHFARSEAVSRNRDVQLQFRTPADGAGMSCYTIYVDTSPDPTLKCDCTQPAGLRCTQATTQEIRTVQIPLDRGVRLSLPASQARGFAFMNTTGALRIGGVVVAARLSDYVVESSLDSSRRLRNAVGRSGRPTTCSPAGSVSGVAAC